MRAALTNTNGEFHEAHRHLAGLTARAERRALVFLAARTAGWITSDHLTLLGLASTAACGILYAASGRWPWLLLLVNVGLALNWLGDSLDGTLARHRGVERPRFGFYVDHLADAFGALFLLAGLALSGLMSPLVAAGVLAAYFLLAIETYLATYAIGRFEISYGPFRRHGAPDPARGRQPLRPAPPGVDARGGGVAGLRRPRRRGRRRARGPLGRLGSARALGGLEGWAPARTIHEAGRAPVPRSRSRSAPGTPRIPSRALTSVFARRRSGLRRCRYAPTARKSGSFARRQDVPANDPCQSFMMSTSSLTAAADFVEGGGLRSVSLISRSSRRPAARA